MRDLHILRLSFWDVRVTIWRPPGPEVQRARQGTMKSRSLRPVGVRVRRVFCTASGRRDLREDQIQMLTKLCQPLLIFFKTFYVASVPCLCQVCRLLTHFDENVINFHIIEHIKLICGRGKHCRKQVKNIEA